MDMERAGDQRQKSHRKNPILADVMGRMNFMERRGSGLMLISQSTAREETYKPQFKPTFKNYCDAYYVTLYNMRWDAQAGTIAQVRLADLKGVVATEDEAVPDIDPAAPQVTDQVTDQVAALLAYIQGSETSAIDAMTALRLTHRPTFRENYLNPALDAGLIERTIPDKPKSRLQKYRLTELGQSTLAVLTSNGRTNNHTEREGAHDN